MSIIGPMLVAGNAMEMFSNAMQITGDNIANLNTVSFRSSRFTFDDVMPTVWGEVETGHGARLADVGKPFQQGSLETTTGALDLAISGNGFFIVRDPLSGSLRYTRAGEFHLDNAGQMVNPGGQVLQGTAGDIVINTALTTPAQATANLALQLNLDAASATPSAPLPLGPDASPGQWVAASNFSTVATIYDSQGTSHDLTFLFRLSAPNTWDYQVVAPRNELDPSAPSSTDLRQVGAPGTLVFTAAGQLNTGASSIGAINGLNWTNGASQSIGAAGIDFTGTVQFARPSFLFGLVQDGFAAGTLNGIAIDPQGNVNGRFTNGINQQLASIAMANFNDVDDLDPLGNTLFAQSFESGAAQTGAPGQNGLGSLVAGSLELSTVDLAREFVALLSLQRAFQVNSRVVTTAEQMYGIAAQLKG